MFGNFTGQTRRPRQINLSGRRNQQFQAGPSSTAFGARKTVQHAQHEREQRSVEKRERSATFLIQRVWKGRRQAARTRRQFRDEWDALSGYSRGTTATPNWTFQDTVRNSVLFLAFFKRIGPLDMEELLRVGFLCKMATLDHEDETLEGERVEVLACFSKRIFGIILRRLGSFSFTAGMTERDFRNSGSAISQVIRYLGRNAETFPELAVKEYATLTLPKSQPISYYALLSHLASVLQTLPADLQSQFTTPSISFASLSPLRNTESSPETQKAISNDLATKLFGAEDLPRLLSAGDGYGTLCKDPVLFKALVGEKDYSVPESYGGLGIEKQLWLLATVIHIARLRELSRPGVKDIEFLAVLSKMLGYVSKQVAQRIDLQDATMEDVGRDNQHNNRPSHQPLPPYVKEQLTWLCQKSTFSTLLETASPLGTSAVLREARIFASYALTLILLFPSKRQDLRMWLCMSTTSDGTPALQYFWKAARSTDLYKKIQAQAGEKSVVRLLKGKLRTAEENDRRDRDWCVIFLFFELYSLMLTVMDDDDFFSGQNRDVIKGTKGAALPIVEVVHLSVFLKNLCYGVYWNAQELLDDPKNPLGGRVFENDEAGEITSLIGVEGMTVNYLKGTVTSLLKQLYIRDSRRKFCPTGHWLMTSQFEMAGFIEGVVEEEEARRLAELEASDEESDGEDEDMSGTPAMHSVIRQQARKTFLSTIGPRLDIVQNLPFFIPFETRVEIFRTFVAQDQERRQSGATSVVPRSSHARQHRADLHDLAHRGPRHHGTIRRENLVEDAMKEFYPLGETLKDPIRITFVDKFGEAEAGIDGGGVTKEFLTSVTKEAFVPGEQNLFCENKDHFLYPNPGSILALRTEARRIGLTPEETQEQVKELLKRYEFLGRVVGKCLYEGILLEIGFAGFFLLKWAFKGAANDGYRPSVNDLRDLDEDLYNGMILLKNYPGDVEHELSIDFSLTTKVLGQNHTIELRPNGHNIPVTNSNRLEYIHLVSRYHLQIQSEPQTNAFLRGLGLMIRPSWLAMFNQVELQILVAGDLLNAIDLSDLRSHTSYSGVYDRGHDEYGRPGPEHQVIQWFWEVMEEFSEEERRKVLKFVTSVSRAPLLGFKALFPPFTIRDSTSTGPMGETDRLPSASTCVNLLKLPRYRDKQTLKTKLTYAVNSGAGFDLS